MSKPRRKKKSEKLEVRLTHSEKRALQMEAREQGQSVSELVRGVLSRHMREQPYLAHALAPARRHPRKILTGLFVAMASGAMALIVSPFAQAEPSTVDLVGQIKSTAQDVRQVLRFHTKVELNENGHGTYLLQNNGQPMSVLGRAARPHRIKVAVTQSPEHKNPDGTATYYVRMEIIERVGNADEIAAAPSLLVAENSLVQVDVAGESGIRYAITAQLSTD